MGRRGARAREVAMAAVVLQLAVHLASRELFILIAQPDGPFVAISPVTDAADALVMKEIPAARPMVVSGVAAWANRQRWQPLMGLALRRGPDDEWETYDPREGER